MFIRYTILCIAMLAIITPCVVIAFSAKRMFNFLSALKSTDHKTICPKCHKSFIPRRFLCHCGAEVNLTIHDGLQYAVCARCRKKIPKMIKFGRDNYHSLCTYCNTDNGINAGKYPLMVVPVIGGTSTGKTSFISAFIVSCFNNGNKTGPYSVAFPYPGNERFIADSKKQWCLGQSPEKTRERLPEGIVVDFVGHIKHDLGYRMYFYDPAGEYFDKTNKLRAFQYYKSMEGVIFLIDPFSIRKFRSSYEQNLQFQNNSDVSNFQISDKDVDDYCDIFINGLLRYHGLTHNERLNAVCAVVITKADAYILDNLIGEKAIKKYMLQHRHISRRDAMDKICRNFLNNMEAGIVLTKLNENFDEIRCFSVSAFGHMPDIGKPYIPHRVEEPILWILEKKRGDAMFSYKNKIERDTNPKKGMVDSFREFWEQN